MRIATAVLAPILLIASSGASAQALRAELDRSELAAGERLTLTLEVDGTTPGGKPDLTPLAKDFEVLGTAATTELQTGQQNAKSRFRIELMPKRKGRLAVPSLTWGKKASIALSVEVRSASGAKGSTDMFIEVDVSPRRPFVQQQVLYTVRVFSARGHPDGPLTQPKPPHTDVYQLVDKRSFTAKRNNRRFAVMEWRFALFAQKSGQLTIPPVVFGGSMQQRGSGVSTLSPLLTRGRRVRLASDAEQVTVRPRSESFGGATWLPARNLQIAEDFPPASAGEFKVGEPIMRTVRLSAEGLTGNQLPELSLPEVQGIRQYPDQPSSKSTGAKDGVSGVREQRFALVPNQPGEFELSEIRLPWWDVVANEERVAVIAARKITVAGVANNGLKLSRAMKPGAANGAPPSTPEASIAENEDADRWFATSPALPAIAELGLWQAVSAGFAALWLATLFALWRSRARTKTRVEPDKPDERRHAGKAKQRLRKACARNDAAGARDALYASLVAIEPQARRMGLMEAASRTGDQRFADEVQTLDRALYAGGASNWSGDQLWKAANSALGKLAKKAADPVPVEGLPPLYPQRT